MEVRIGPNRLGDEGTNLGHENLLENLGVGGEAADTLVELVEGHLVLEEGPAEGGLVVDVRDLLVLLATGSCEGRA